MNTVPHAPRPLGPSAAGHASRTSSLCLAFVPLALLLPISLPGANTWDGGAGNALWSSAANWDNDLVPVSPLAGKLSFPATAPFRSVDLGASTRAAREMELLGGYLLSNGRTEIVPGGTGFIRSVGNNTLSANYGVSSTGPSDVKFAQNGPGTFTITGAHTAPRRGVAVWGDGGGVVRFDTALALDGTHAFSNWNLGHTVFPAGSGITGGGAGTTLYATRGSVVLNGTSPATVKEWLVDGGVLAGTGTINSPVKVGTGGFDPVAYLTSLDLATTGTLSGLISPGDPLADNTIGSLTVNGATTFGPRGGLLIELGALAGSSDRLVINGDLTVDAATALAVVPPKFGAPSGTYLIATWSGTGSFASPTPFDLHTLPEGYAVQIDAANKQVKLVPGAAVAESVVFPSDSGVLDVTRTPYNAVPDDGLDDTAAIQAALFAAPNGRRIVYLPNGTYHVSNSLLWPSDPSNAGNSHKRTVLQGQSRAGVILRLADSASGFGSASTPKPLINIERSGGTLAAQFRNGVRNLTLHTGSNNPGAIGLHFVAHNQGQVERVKIVSGDGRGHIGLDLGAGLNGPLLVRDLEVHGFTTGVRTSDVANSITLEKIRLFNQGAAGLANSGQVVSIHDIAIVGSAQPIINGNPENPAQQLNGGFYYGGVLTLQKGRFFGGFNGLRSAINGQGFSTLQDVRSFGRYRVYERRVQDGILPAVTGDAYKTAQSLPFYVQTGLAATTHGGSARLGVIAPEPTPRVAWAPLSDWANVRSHGAVGDGTTDDTAAIQAAIDAGKSHVYFPAGYNYRVNGVVTVRGAVSRLIGCDALFSAGPDARFVVGPGAPATVVIERMDRFPRIEHGARDLVVANSIVEVGITSTAPARLFLDDIATQRVAFDHPGLQVYARQLNVEGDGGVQVDNKDALVWILGLKAEKAATRVRGSGYAVTEVLGSFSYNTATLGAIPAYRLLDDATLFVAGSAEAAGLGTGYNYATWVEHTRGGVTQRIENGVSPAVVSRTSANGRFLSLYGGPEPVEPPAVVAPAAPTGVTASALGTGSVKFTFVDQSNNETGFALAYKRSADSGWTSVSPEPGADGTGTVIEVVFPNLQAGTPYQFRVQAVNVSLTSAWISASATTQASPSGTLNVTAITLSSGATALLDTSFAIGDLVYTDRPYTWSAAPAPLAGKPWISLPNNDKNLSAPATNYLSFTVNTPVTVHVLYDTRATALPAWLSGFTFTGQTVAINGDVRRKVYSKNHPAGSITLGANLAAPAAGVSTSYSVVIAPDGSPPPVSTTTLDFEGLSGGANTLSSGAFLFKGFSAGGAPGRLDLLGAAQGYASRVLHPQNHGARITLERSDGAAFSLRSFGYAEGRYGTNGDLIVSATRVDGGTLTTTQLGFSTRTMTPFELPATWTSLTKVTFDWSGAGSTNLAFGAIDAIVVQ
jgi:hypothetical protein